MRLKRLLAFMLCMIILPCCAIPTAYATDETTTPTNAKTQKETNSPITAQSLGMSRYVKHLETMTYKGNLGATYTKSKTTFKLWSPLADSVKVCIYTKGTDGEDGAQMISKNSMKLYEKHGTWVLTLNGDYKNKYYTYLVTINGVTHEVVDPYAKAVGANGDRGMVVDLNSTDPKGWNKDKFTRVDNASDAIIWEVNVRDFSASETSGVSEENRGKFLAFTEQGTVVDSVDGSLSTCIDYLKDLGVNYVQINPFYDFASIDETDAVNPQYNWGYDPKNYNVPEGSYSSNPYDGNVRIKECKQMIQALHNAGIGVIMDVVYNHTYASQDSFFNLIVPDYYYRIDDSGNWSNGSGCGNDTASERVMFREFMKNSVVYWAQEYHIDGFRFDLMGLHDVDTMNYIRKSLDKLKDGKKILMYGEAWELETNVSGTVKLANQSNLSQLSNRIGAFNDTIRDGLKGNVFDSKDTGFVQSGSNKSKVKSGIEGMSTAGTWGTLPAQSVNYASCHDNLSLYDKLVASVYPDEGNYRKRREDLMSMNKLTAAIILTSQGVPFMMAGEEMARSKDGDENSYKSPVEVNQIDWNNLNMYADLNDYYKGLIDIRQTVDLLRDSTGDVANSISYINDTDDGVIAYALKGSGNTHAFAAVFNGSDKDTTVKLPDGLCVTWVRMADENSAGIKCIEEISDNKVNVKPHSCAILVNKSSFTKYAGIDKTKTVTVKYLDSYSDSIVYEQILKGEQGEQYSFEYPNSLLYDYDITSISGSKTGEFGSKDKEVIVHCRAYTGDYSSVTINFVNEFDEQIANSIVMSNRVGQQYTTPRLPTIYGYRLDLDNLPTNGAGKYTSDEITVTYRYNSIEVSAEQQAVDPDMLSDENVCIANVIYMSDSGEILEKKTYAGDIDTEIVIEYIDIPGYLYISDTSENAVFSTDETNIVVNYSKQFTKQKIVPIIVCVMVVAVVILVIVLITRKRRNDYYFDYEEIDDLYIE